VCLTSVEGELGARPSQNWGGAIAFAVIGEAGCRRHGNWLEGDWSYYNLSLKQSKYVSYWAGLITTFP
jgi:hypothetical protein